MWVNSADRVIRLRAGSTGEPTGRSGSQRATAFAAPASHDGTTRTGTHPQPESVNPGPAPIVWLEGALTLGHGYLSSSHLRRRHRGNSRSTAAAPVAKLPANRRGPVSGRCRAARGWATFMRVLRSLPQVKPRCSAPARPVDKSRSRCWHNGRNLLTSASAVKRDRGFARFPPPHEDLVPICRGTKTLSPDLYTAVNNLVDSFSGGSGPRGLRPIRGICFD